MLKSIPYKSAGVYFVMQIIFLFVFATTAAQTRKPNVILILADDVGYNVPGCNGGTSYATPNIDSMAKGGMRFTQCYSSPTCSPSRFTLLTGKYNFRNYSQWGVLDDSEKTIANAFKDAGYKTACFGKWQLDGGDKSIRAFGFDNYSIWQPYQDSFEGHRHINPTIYQNGKYFKAGFNNNKYGEDIFNDSVLNFVGNNKSSPFFIYYSMVLAHSPYQPTPDDSAYSSWNPNTRDIRYYKSMIEYMDKKVGLIIDKLKNLGLDKNTIILYAGDNGTPAGVNKIYDDDDIAEGKGSTTKAGTHVPLIAYWPGKIPAGTTKDDLIDFTDFLPTLTQLAKIPPLDPGSRDGVSFSSALLGQQKKVRDWIFNHYMTVSGLTRWAQIKAYKLYDSVGTYTFYNIGKDSLEEHPVLDSTLTTNEKQKKQLLRDVLDYYATQSAPFLDSSSASEITDTSAQLGATILKEGGFLSVDERGTCYSETGGKTFSSRLLINLLNEGKHKVSTFKHLRTGLLPQIFYYFKGYAINKNGIGVSPVSNFFTLSKGVVSSPSDFEAYPKQTSINLTWSHATFPSFGATNAGYLIIYSKEIPALVALPNGKDPNRVISNGTILYNSSTRLPVLPNSVFTLNKLAEGATHYFLLVPYTWDGKNPATYNYFTSGAKLIYANTAKPVITWVGNR